MSIPQSISERLTQALTEGETDEAEAVALEALQLQLDPLVIISDVMIPALTEVGRQFQAGAIFLTKKLQSEGGAPAGKTPVLCRIEEAKFKGMVKPGDTVSIEVKHVETLQQFHFMTGTVRRDAKAVLTIRFALALVDQPA